MKYHPNYRDEDWLRTELSLGRTISQIANSEGVLEDTIKKWIRHFGIEYQKPKKNVKKDVKDAPTSIEIICPYCGAIFIENVEICEKCGAKIKRK